MATLNTLRLHVLRARRAVAGYNRKTWDWFKRKAERAGLHDWLMVLFTGVLTLVAIGQGILAWQNSQSSAAQMGKIIDAANRIEDAADSFSGSARHINDGMGDAVAKLNSQAGELKKSVGQATRLAKATEAANARALEFDRPWIGIVQAVSGFTEGSTSPSVTFTIINSGRRPAKLTSSVMGESTFVTFPSDPPYPAITTRSTTLLVPNMRVDTVLNILPVNASFPNFALYKSGSLTFFVYANVEYEDVVTHAKHWTHACSRYVPNAPSLNAGFYQCREYNDVDQN